MATIKVLNMSGQNAGTMELKDEIFGIEPNRTQFMKLLRTIWQTEDRVHSPQRLELKFAEAAESHSVKREQVVTDRVLQLTHLRSVEESFSHQSPEAINTQYQSQIGRAHV